MADMERNEPVDREVGPGETRPGKLRKQLNANGKKKPPRERKRRRKVAHKPPGSGAPRMPPGISY